MVVPFVNVVTIIIVVVVVVVVGIANVSIAMLIGIVWYCFGSM